MSTLTQLSYQEHYVEGACEPEWESTKESTQVLQQRLPLWALEQGAGKIPVCRL